MRVVVADSFFLHGGEADRGETDIERANVFDLADGLRALRGAVFRRVVDSAMRLFVVDAIRPSIDGGLQFRGGHLDFDFLSVLHEALREGSARLDGFAVGDAMADIALQFFEEAGRQRPKETLDMRLAFGREWRERVRFISSEEQIDSKCFEV